MLVRVAGSVSSASEVHLAKAPMPMLVKAVGRVSLTRAEQPEKASSPMLVSVAGSVSLASDVHRSKARLPMVTRPPGSTHLEREPQSRKA